MRLPRANALAVVLAAMFLAVGQKERGLLIAILVPGSRTDCVGVGVPVERGILGDGALGDLQESAV